MPPVAFFLGVSFFDVGNVTVPKPGHNIAMFSYALTAVQQLSCHESIYASEMIHELSGISLSVLVWFMHCCPRCTTALDQCLNVNEACSSGFYSNRGRVLSKLNVQLLSCKSPMQHKQPPKLCMPIGPTSHC
jgi:hypothetical protein